MSVPCEFNIRYCQIIIAHTGSYIYMYTHTHVCVSVYVCVCLISKYLCDQSIERQCYIATKDMNQHTHHHPYNDVLSFPMEARFQAKFVLCIQNSSELHEHYSMCVCVCGMKIQIINSGYLAYPSPCEESQLK